MPELPEVETTRRALETHLVGRTITAAILRTEKLRHPLSPELASTLPGEIIRSLYRRAKYLLLGCESGTLIIHLGMTGHLRLAPKGSQPGRFDHLELHLENGNMLRLSDPRKFGSVIWMKDDPFHHHLLKDLGPEPLGNDFTPDYLRGICRKRKVAIKLLLMNSRLLAGVGNIYACEALFRGGLSPLTPAGILNEDDCTRLVASVKYILGEAIARGERTLDTFLTNDEKPSYFPLDAMVYGREGKPCRVCDTAIQREILGGRSTFLCPLCQPVKM